MFDAVATTTGVVDVRPPPDNARSAIGLPSASRGVWQWPHAMMLLTR
jgi:hypothetical protein